MCTIVYLSVYVDQAAVAFGCSIKFTNFWNPESVDKLFPHGGTEAITHRYSDLMTGLRRASGLRQQITTDLTNILDRLGIHMQTGTVTQYFCMTSA